MEAGYRCVRRGGRDLRGGIRARSDDSEAHSIRRVSAGNSGVGGRYSLRERANRFTGDSADPAKGTPAVYGDTKAQATSEILKIQAILKEQGLTLGDVVMMHVYLAGDPAKEGKLDFAGLQAAYTQYFGTADQPNKPARAAMQVAALAAPWALVEIEVIAVRSK